jgi:hypothetical protein
LPSAHPPGSPDLIDDPARISAISDIVAEENGAADVVALRMGKASRECFAIAVDARKQCYQHVQTFGGAALPREEHP